MKRTTVQHRVSTRRRCLDLYASGLTIAAVAGQEGVPLGTVAHWVRTAGIVRPQAAAVRAGKSRAAGKDYDVLRTRALRLYASGMSTPRVGAVLGLPHRTVYHWVRKAGVNRTKAEAAQVRTAIEGTAVKVARSARLVCGDGLTHEQAGAILGLSPYTVRNHVRHVLNPYRSEDALGWPRRHAA